MENTEHVILSLTLYYNLMSVAEISVVEVLKKEWLSQLQVACMQQTRG